MQAASSYFVTQPCIPSLPLPRPYSDPNPFLYVRHQLSSTTLLLPQGPRKQRLLRRDFGKGPNKRDDAFREDKPQFKRNEFLGAADLQNEAFEEYYQHQV